jgi:hypothetical protein
MRTFSCVHVVPTGLLSQIYGRFAMSVCSTTSKAVHRLFGKFAIPATDWFLFSILIRHIQHPAWEEKINVIATVSRVRRAGYSRA